MPEEQQLPLVARSHDLHVRGVRPERREADFVASTDAIDAYDEIVDQSWRLERFAANPIVLYAHQSRELPIGTATNCQVLDGKLVCTIRFVTEDKNPKAEQVWKMVRDAELRAVSVGFVPHTIKSEKRNDRYVYVLSDNELHEISVVPIPANPEALSKMKAKALAEAEALAHGDIHIRSGVSPDVTEKTMTEKEMQEQVAKLAAEKALAEKHLGDASKALEAANASVAALTKQNATLAEERDTAIGDRDAMRDQLIEAEVSALVGVKIAPAEKDDFVALRKTNPDLYAKFVAQRADKKLTENVIPTKQAPAAASGDAGEPDLATDVLKSA
jgi:HK97 family phage prohead protease